jgi:hypothetical protein
MPRSVLAEPSRKQAHYAPSRLQPGTGSRSQVCADVAHGDGCAHVPDEGVAGSNPATPTKNLPINQYTLDRVEADCDLGGQIWGQNEAVPRPHRLHLTHTPRDPAVDAAINHKEPLINC